MRCKRAVALTVLAGSLAVATSAALYELAEARQRPVVVLRMLTGFFDRKSRFVATAGRFSTNVDRNAIVLFVFSGAIDMGERRKATLPLTLAEQSALSDGGVFEPGVIDRRDSPFKEARYVATGSVTTDSVSIAAPSAGGGEVQAPGVFFRVPRARGGGRRLYKNRLAFNPRFVQATFNNPQEIDYNPEGYEANTRYDVLLDGGPDAVNPFNTLTNLSGLPLATPLQTFFATTDEYLQDFSRPEIRETSPTDRAANVASDADIDITFSEPMLLDSFLLPRFQGDDNWTMRVAYTDAPQNGTLAGLNILGFVRVKPQTAGNVVQFRPIQGFGTGPYEIEATIAAGVTDLSGNNIIRQQRIVFETELNADADDFGRIEENFDDNTTEDSQFQPTGDNDTADWNTSVKEGYLTTTVAGKTFDADTPNSTTSINVWFVNALKMQILYPPAQMNQRARTLTGFDWWSRGSVGQTYPNTVVRMAHANSVVGSSGFSGTAGPVDANFRETPRLMYTSAPYTTTTLLNPVPGPAFSQSFNYDGTNGLILEISHSGHGAALDEQWEADGGFAINAFTFQINTTPPGAPTNQPWFFRTQWRFLSPGAEAQSTWYDVGIANARYLPQQIVPLLQPPGTSVQFLWQGAKSDVSNPNVRDPSSETLWVTDVRQLANHRFLRFQVQLGNNLNTLEAPEIDILTEPYNFR